MPDYSKTPEPPQEPGETKPEKVVERVVVSEVITDNRTQTVRNKIRRIFGGTDVRTAIRYATEEIVFPSVRELLADSVRVVSEQIIFGGSRGRRGGRSDRPHALDDPRDRRPRYQYSTSSRRANLPDQGPRYASRYERTSQRYDDFREITLTSRIDAERVLEELLNIVDRYGAASVADLYDCVGLPPIHTDQKWGWVNLRRAEIYSTKDGYKIDLPSAEPL